MKGKDLGKRALCVYLGRFGKLRKIKSFFVLLWVNTKLFFVNGPSTLVDFIDWVGSK